MTKYLVVYCYEQTKMDGIVIRIVKEGVFDTDEEAQAAEEEVWARFEGASAQKRPSYLLTTETIPIE